MGAWGPGNLENDDALDWVGSLDEDGAKRVTEAFQTVFDARDEGMVEAPEAAEALAAAEAVAYAFGMALPELDKDATRVFDAHSEEIAALEEIRSRAVEAIDAIMASPERSELLELWEEAEAEDAVAFRDAVAGLRTRLEA